MVILSPRNDMTTLQNIPYKSVANCFTFPKTVAKQSSLGLCISTRNHRELLSTHQPHCRPLGHLRQKIPLIITLKFQISISIKGKRKCKCVNSNAISNLNPNANGCCSAEGRRPTFSGQLSFQIHICDLINLIC